VPDKNNPDNPKDLGAESPTQPLPSSEASSKAVPEDVKTVVQSGINPTLTINPIHLPIYVNVNPAISSLSPAGATVGGAAFTLTVLGSNFGSGSTVNWNQSARPTTLVSSTQLTAAIGAADIAGVTAAAVAVANQGAPGTAQVMSNIVTFMVIPDISSIINQLKAVPNLPPVLLTDLQTYVTNQQSQIDTLTTQGNNDQATISGLNIQIANLQTQVTQQQTEITTLTAQLQAAKAQSASPMDVAQSFKNVVDQIQQSALAAGGLQSVVTNMNVQLKSLVSVQSASGTTPASATLIFPDPTALPDPGHLSTLSFSFGSIPSLKAVTPPAQQTPVAAPAAANTNPSGKPSSGTKSKS
jgi:uncharacterized coiled-coil protein SlyX